MLLPGLHRPAVGVVQTLCTAKAPGGWPAQPHYTMRITTQPEIAMLILQHGFNPDKITAILQLHISQPRLALTNFVQMLVVGAPQALLRVKIQTFNMALSGVVR